MNPGKRARWWMVMSTVAAVTALLHARPLVFPMTESVKYHVLVKVSGKPAKGEYVNVALYHESIDRDQAVRLTKRVACVAGEVLKAGRGAHWCNGEFLGVVLQRDTRGVPLPQFTWNGPVPPDKVFLSGDHIRSFDSRYFGFVNAAALERLRPIF
jgi:conjugal transfer pilin signal peptidase TrbI